MPVIYVLPKVHKSLNNVLGQPIVSGMGSLTEPLSNFIDAHIWTLSICVYTTIIHFLPILFFINVTFMIFLWSLREVKQNWFPFYWGNLGRLNSVYANIIGLEFSQTSVNFLNTLFSVNNGILSTSLYV